MKNHHRPGVLEDCIDHGKGTELLIVEGESAAKSLCRVRDVRWQAVLPMQGKPLNATKADEKAIRSNPQFAILLESLGTDIGAQFELDACRYERIILLFDPDADGIHARTLMLLFFDQWMRPLLDAGRIFDLRIPRFRVTSSEWHGSKFLYADEDIDGWKQQMEVSGVPFQMHHHRGVGSVDQATLESLCIDPAKRQLQILSTSDAKAAIAFFDQLRNIILTD